MLPTGLLPNSLPETFRQRRCHSLSSRLPAATRNEQLKLVERTRPSRQTSVSRVRQQSHGMHLAPRGSSGSSECVIISGGPTGDPGNGPTRQIADGVEAMTEGTADRGPDDLNREVLAIWERKAAF